MTTSRTIQTEERRKLRNPDAAERAKLVRRCKASYLDLSISRSQWEARYPIDVREDAMHRMSLDELRCRG